MGSKGTPIDSQATTGSTPDDVARLYAWANLRGAKYRDYSASRREHRAQVRYSAAKALLDRELKAQSEAESSAQAAEQEAREAEARALAAGTNQPQQARLAALRAAEAAGLKAAADRVEAARRAESAARATVVALREERELAEASASAAEQAMIYTEADALRRQLAGPQPQLNLSSSAAAPPPSVPTATPTAPEPSSVTAPEPPSLPEAAPDAAKPGSWQPLSEAILDPGEGWNAARPARNSAASTAPASAEENLRPEWLVVLPQIPAPQSPAPSQDQRSSHAQATPQNLTPPQSPTPSEPTERAAPISPPLAHAEPAAEPVAEPAAEPAPEPIARTPKVGTPLLVVFSPAAGAGTTSLVANLGRALSAVDETVLLVDATSQARLPFYFGGRELRPGLMRTWTPPAGSDRSVSVVLHDATRPLEETAQQQLTQQIFANALGAQRILVDLPTSPDWLLRRLSHLQPAILIPIVPGPRAHFVIDSAEKLFRDLNLGNPEPTLPFYLLNQLDPSQPSHGEQEAALRHLLGARLLPVAIPPSPAIPAALAEGNTVFDHEPDAPILQQYRAVVVWLQSISPARPASSAHLPWGQP